MNKDEINKLSKTILDAAYEVYYALGPGLLEYSYKLALRQELALRGLKVEMEWPISFVYKGVELPHSYRADLLIEDEIIVELKSTEVDNAVHVKQLLTYIKLSDKRLGLLINLNKSKLSEGIKRVVNNL